MQIKPEVSLNTMLSVVALAGLLYAAYKIKQGIGSVSDSVGDWWEGVDLNPFDDQGIIGSVINTPAIVEDLATAAKKALAAKGKNIDNYILYFPKAGEKLPADSWSVKYQNKTYYYIPRSSVGTFGKWISL